MEKERTQYDRSFKDNAAKLSYERNVSELAIWYNRKRRHSFLNKLNIEEFWEQYNL